MDEFFDWLNTLFQNSTPTLEAEVCPHEKVAGVFTVEVRGVAFPRVSSDRCPACAQQFAEQYSTTCASCAQPILPGTLVARSGRNDVPFVHNNDSCRSDPLQYCGMWGEGELIDLHAMKPEKYPPGTRSLHDHAEHPPHHEHRHHH